MDTDSNKVLFRPFSSHLSPGFWQHLTNIKLNKLKLSQEPVDIHGSYTGLPSAISKCLAFFDYDSFHDKTHLTRKSECSIYGQLVCTNVMNEFKAIISQEDFLTQQGSKIWQSIKDGRALRDPELYLSRVVVAVFADLKKYKYYYWFAFPAVNYPRDICLDSEKIADDHCSISHEFNGENIKQIYQLYDLPSAQRDFQRGYFLIRKAVEGETGQSRVSLLPLTEYHDATKSKQGERDVRVYFAFTDPESSDTYPGWPLRNYLALIAAQFKLESVSVIRFRHRQTPDNSIPEVNQCKIMKLRLAYDSNFDNASNEVPTVTGWEKDEQDRMAPRRVDLSKLLDPKRIADEAVNLNLKLMKWRLLPGLDLEKIANNRCLILGCGTLGCHIVRGLLAWGVKNISLVDNSKVSFSNPVRQSLYTFDDCRKATPSFKSHAAAAAVKAIHPSANVESYVLSIPMPGHQVTDLECNQVAEDVQKLEQLVRSHDSVFLLMDTRESRWLPTVIAKSEGKLVINAAIGFDTFLLQRYGVRDYSAELSPEEAQDFSADQLSSNRLGCYFCNDIVAPGNSTLDRTLDQQCTVSRPGVSMMVSALAVELWASVISSRLGASSPAPLKPPPDLTLSNEADYETELGIMPHTIRGNLARFLTYTPTCPSFNKCSACSSAVIEAYRSQGFGFLRRVFDKPNYLEEITGLEDLQNVDDNVWALESGSECGDDDGNEDG